MNNTSKTPIVCTFSASSFFAPYLCVSLMSLVEHCSNENEYKIYIFETDITQKNKDLLEKSVSKTNVELNFINLTELTSNKEFIAHDHVSEHTFFKFFIPKILKQYDKVLFCDSDVIFQNDVAKLYNTDLKDKKLAAGLCNLWNGIINYDSAEYDYTCNTLKIKNTDNYFQCGILLFNNRLINENDIENLLKMAQTRSYHCLDQDILNSYFQNDVIIFDSNWNYETSQEGFRKISIPFMDEKHLKIWEKAKENPYIIHYSGCEKPWLFPDEEMAKIWWGYARKTPFYEEILARLMDFKVTQKLPTIYMMEHPFRNFVKKISYKIKKQIGSKAYRSKYKEKYNRINSKLKEIKNLRNLAKKF